MEDLASAIQASDLARALRQSRWTYPAINAAHILGVALLVGAVVPMDLRLIGVWRSDVRLQTVLRLLRPLAVAGAALALVTGALLFVVQASEYAATRLFYAKMALVAIGLGHALANPRICRRAVALPVGDGARLRPDARLHLSEPTGYMWSMRP